VTRRYYDEGELAVSATADVATFYAEDHLGSVRYLRMGDGQVLASYDYDPYGAPTHSSETGGVTADYRYAGLVHHAPSGLYLANYRGYSPTTGRWISRDPIGEAGGIKETLNNPPKPAPWA
jgi:RHS repeat-associated protein